MKTLGKKGKICFYFFGIFDSTKYVYVLIEDDIRLKEINFIFRVGIKTKFNNI